MRGIAVAVLVAAISMWSGSGVVSAAPAVDFAAGDEAAFVEKINGLRRAAGLSTLTVDRELTSQARVWAATMAAEDSLHHAGDLSVGVTARWQVLGENVGVHSVHDLDALFGAFVNSPGHYANLVDPRYTSVGVGVVHAADGKIWTTHRFMALADQPAPPAPSPPPPTVPPTIAPRTTAPPTTASPTTAQPTTAPPTTASPTTAPPTTAPPTTRPTTATAPPTTAPPTSTRRPTTAAPATALASAAPPVADRPTTSGLAATIPPTTVGPQSSAVKPEAIDVDLITELLIDLAESGL